MVSSLNNYDALLKLFKQIASETIAAGAPAAVCFGTVTSDDPLMIKVDQRLDLTAAQLVLSRNVTDFYTDETVDHLTENRAGGSGNSSYESHNHNYKGRKSFLIHHKLVVGDKVVLLRVQGGQQYVVLDRVVM